MDRNRIQTVLIYQHSISMDPDLMSPPGNCKDVRSDIFVYA